MTTLHIEHQISDLKTWLAAFGRFSGARQKAGVRGQRLYQPVGDDKYIVLDLDFDTVDEAVRFKKFLESDTSGHRVMPRLGSRARLRRGFCSTFL